MALERSMRKRTRISFEEFNDDEDDSMPETEDTEEDLLTTKDTLWTYTHYPPKTKFFYQKKWEREHYWLSGDPDDPTHALCKICGKKIRAHKGDIEKHQKTKRHLKKQTTSDILADLIPISCGDGLNNGDEYSRHEENLDGTKNSEMDHSDARIVTHSGGPVSDGQQIIYFTESAVDTSQQNTNTIIDKLVEKYHQKRIENLKVEHEATLDLNKEQLGIFKQQLEAEATLNDNKNTLAREEHEIRLKFLQREHEAKLKAIEDERDARLRAIEQKLVFARQEYEKKMRLLDVQLSSMNSSHVSAVENSRSQILCLPMTTVVTSNTSVNCQEVHSTSVNCEVYPTSVHPNVNCVRMPSTGVNFVEIPNSSNQAENHVIVIDTSDNTVNMPPPPNEYF